MVSYPSAEIPDAKSKTGKTKVGGIPKAFNRVEHHDALFSVYEPLIQASAAAGFYNVICFSGNRDGLDDEAGLKNLRHWPPAPAAGRGEAQGHALHGNCSTAA